MLVKCIHNHIIYVYILQTHTHILYYSADSFKILIYSTFSITRKHTLFPYLKWVMKVVMKFNIDRICFFPPSNFIALSTYDTLNFTKRVGYSSGFRFFF